MTSKGSIGEEWRTGFYRVATNEGSRGGERVTGANEMSSNRGFLKGWSN